MFFFLIILFGLRSLGNLENLLPHAAENHHVAIFKPDILTHWQLSVSSKLKAIILFGIYLFFILPFVFCGFTFLKARERVQNPLDLPFHVGFGAITPSPNILCALCCFLFHFLQDLQQNFLLPVDCLFTAIV